MSTSKMTSRERVFAAVTMESLPDQVPVCPLLMTRGIREGNVRVDEVLLDGEAQAKAKIKAHQKFGGDVVIAGTDLFTPVENLGAVLGGCCVTQCFPDNAAQWCLYRALSEKPPTKKLDMSAS